MKYLVNNNTNDLAEDIIYMLKYANAPVRILVLAPVYEISQRVINIVADKYGKTVKTDVDRVELFLNDGTVIIGRLINTLDKLRGYKTDYIAIANVTGVSETLLKRILTEL